MKVPKATALPSGQWRAQVMVDKKRVSVTAPSEKEAVAKAAVIKAKLEQAHKRPATLTVGEAIDRYIESKDAVLSPATVAGYNRIRENTLQGIMPVQLAALTQEKVQREVNAMSKTHSPKSVRNAHGLLSAALAEYLPNLTLRTTLPQKQRYEAAIPSDEDIEKIINTSSGTAMELPVLLAVWLGLRVSEIRGLTWACVKNNTLHIRQAIVDANGKPKLKGTKTYSGNRVLRLPPPIADLIERQPRSGDYIVTLTGQAIYKRFTRLCEKAGIDHFRFHDLRHTNASVMLALNIPDKYAMERMGHATNNMLKTVYQHTMKSKQDEVADMVDNYFTQKLHTELHTKKQGT